MDRSALITVFEQVRALVALPGNDFAWSGWEDSGDALAEIDGILAALRAETAPKPGQMQLLFAPTGPLQELSLSSGWGDDFVALADSFDAALL